MRWPRIAGLAALALLSVACKAQTATEIDAVVAGALSELQLPGVAVAITRHQQVLYAQSHGLADVVTGSAVTAQTLFKLGSISKPITALALGLLADEGRLAFSDPLGRFIPELHRLQPRLARVSLRQLLSHQTGLNLEPFEVLMWPQPNDHRFKSLLAGLARTGPQIEVTPGFHYSNLNYLLAAEVLRRVAGQPYRRFVENRIFKPLGMHCVAGGFEAPERPFAAQSHLLMKGAWQRVRLDADTLAEGLDAAAGGVRCDVQGLSRWLLFQLHGSAALPVTPATWQALHQGLVATPGAPGEAQLYGLGLQINSTAQGPRWDHLGGVAGAVAYFAVWPQTGLGLAVVVNGQAAAARNALVQRLVALLNNTAAREPSAAVEPTLVDSTGPVLRPLNKQQVSTWSGLYADTWFGPLRLCPAADGVSWVSQRSARLTGRLLSLAVATQKDQTALLWDDLAVDSDSVLQAERSTNGRVASFKLRPLSAQGLSDFDFSALHFKRVGNCTKAKTRSAPRTPQRS